MMSSLKKEFAGMKLAIRHVVMKPVQYSLMMVSFIGEEKARRTLGIHILLPRFRSLLEQGREMRIVNSPRQLTRMPIVGVF